LKIWLNLVAKYCQTGQYSFFQQNSDFAENGDDSRR